VVVLHGLLSQRAALVGAEHEAVGRAALLGVAVQSVLLVVQQRLEAFGAQAIGPPCHLHLDDA
jgi:hypothetical protein